MNRIFALPILLIAISGCGPSEAKTYPVSGKVMFNSKPFEGAEVTFHNTSGGRSATALTDVDGKFQLSTNKTNDGAEAGEYPVTISKVSLKSGGKNSTKTDAGNGEFGADYGAQMAAAASGTLGKLQKNDLPDKYGKAGESGLKRTVVANSKNDFDFDLK